jgi:Protein of unknown function (DUF1515)
MERLRVCSARLQKIRHAAVQEGVTEMTPVTDDVRLSKLMGAARLAP